MTSISPYQYQASELANLIHSDPAMIRDVAEFYAKRTAQHKQSLNTHVWWSDEDLARQISEQTTRIEAAKKSGKFLPLAGVPIAVKDNICVRQQPTTCGSKILKNFVSTYDATVISRLREAGALFFGKANCDEFAMGSSNENSAYGAVKNPWQKDCVPGGSSGGSAALVAADLAPMALGSDTGGSIRQPASFCGIVGLKPTYGRVSRYGLVAYGSSLDQIGPMTRSVSDAALLYDVLSGHDPQDSTSLNQPPENVAEHLRSNTRKDFKGLKVGLVQEFFREGLSTDVRAVLEKAIQQIKDLGGEVVEVSLPHLKYSIAAYYVVATAEASANLARFDGIRYGYRSQGGDQQSLSDLYQMSRSEGFGREVKQRIILGTFVLSSGYYDAFYAKANRVRQLITDDFKQAFSKVDLLISPTAPTTAFKIGEKANDPIAMYLSDICTIGVNLAGIPALSIPCGFDSKNLPVGLQLMGPHGSEKKLLTEAFIYEQATDWHKRHPEEFRR